MSKEKTAEAVEETVAPGTEETQKAEKSEAMPIRLKYEKELDELYDQLEEGGYFDRTYAEGSKVQMDGPMLASLVNFINDHKRTLYSMQQIMNVALTTIDAMLADNAAVTIELMKIHRDNVDAGNSISQAEMDKLDAKEKIKEVPVAKKGKGGNRGSKATGKK